jgi:hypothetical protein
MQDVEATPPNGVCKGCTLSEVEAATRFLANIKAP